MQPKPNVNWFVEECRLNPAANSTLALRYPEHEPSQMDSHACLYTLSHTHTCALTHACTHTHGHIRIHTLRHHTRHTHGHHTHTHGHHTHTGTHTHTSAPAAAHFSRNTRVYPGHALLFETATTPTPSPSSTPHAHTATPMLTHTSHACPHRHPHDDGRQPSHRGDRASGAYM